MKKQPTTVDIAEKKRRAEMLTRSLGPEYLDQRVGPGGGKLTYIAGKTAIELANDIFGYDGWSTEIRSTTIDQDECVNGLYTIGISAVIRVTLKEGNYHEDCGFGVAENMRSKVAALEKARKEACTDAFKRALRMFGNAVGNCLYDKRYIQNVGFMKAPAIPFEPSKLLRVRHITPREIYSGAAKGESSSTTTAPPPPPPLQAAATSSTAAQNQTEAPKPSPAQTPQPKRSSPPETLARTTSNRNRVVVKAENKANMVIPRSPPQRLQPKYEEDDDLPVVSNLPPNEHAPLMTQTTFLIREDSFTSDADDAFFEAIAMQEEKYQQAQSNSPHVKRKMPDGSEFTRKIKRTFF